MPSDEFQYAAKLKNNGFTLVLPEEENKNPNIIYFSNVVNEKTAAQEIVKMEREELSSGNRIPTQDLTRLGARISEISENKMTSTMLNWIAVKTIMRLGRHHFLNQNSYEAYLDDYFLYIKDFAESK